MISVKNDFPIFKNYPDLVYLDSAATSQKPKTVIDAVTNFYSYSNSNVHRGIYPLSDKATQIFEDSRGKVATFIGAKPKEIIFTANASEAINYVAIGFADKYLKRGDIVIVSETEHHSNLVPWLRLKNKGIKLIYLPVNDSYRLEYEKIILPKNLKKRIKLIALTHASNVLGTINPVNKIIKFFKENGIEAKILIDAAQSVPHFPVNVKKINCDFLVFSSHKMLGPSGLGVLWAKDELLNVMNPVFVGSHMISKVTKKHATWANLPDKFEVGTGRLEAAAGLGAAVDYLNKMGMEKVEEHERKLTVYALSVLTKIDKLTVYGSINPEERLGVFSFNIKGIHPHDVGEILGRRNICVRTGHHCAQPLMKVLGVNGTVRASLYIYNDKTDIDKLIDGIMEVKRMFKK